MKGRSATKLLRQVEAWHGHLARVSDVVFQSWQTCGLRPYEIEDETPEIGKVRWTVQCADGQTSIWSIGLQGEQDEEREGILTVAVDPKKRAVTLARGKYNMLPNQAPRSAQAQKAASAGYMEKINRRPRSDLASWLAESKHPK